MRGFVAACFLFFMWGVGAGSLWMGNTKEHQTIRSHHRLTPRLELVIDSGRVDTMYVYSKP